MQVTKSIQYYSASETETQSNDTPDCVAISVSPQMNQISWPPEPRTPPLDCRAIILHEEIKPVLSVVNKSGFKLRNPELESIPAALIKDKDQIAKISELYRRNAFVEARELAVKFVNAVPAGPECNDFIQYLNNVIFFCCIMQDITSCTHLPATNSEEFINWLLNIADMADNAIADFSAKGSVVLYCWRWAADAGSLKANYLLAKALLFSESCHDTTSKNVRFFPVEALKYLVKMAREGIQLPVPTNNHEVAINGMVELIRLRNDVNFDHEKEKLIDFFWDQTCPEIQLLIPFIYTNEDFGTPDYDKARDAIKKFHECFKENQPDSFCRNVYQFWKAVCGLSHDDSRKSAMNKLYKLADGGSLAAMYCLSELSLAQESVPFKYIGPFILKEDLNILEYPSLAYSLYRNYLFKYLDDKKELARNTKIQSNADALIRGSVRRGDSEIRDILLYSGFVALISGKNLQKIGKIPISSESVKIIVRPLYDSRYTQDPAVFVYLHYVQVVIGVEDKQNLIEKAEQKDALTTYFHMLVVSDATVTMDNTILVDKLLSIIDTDDVEDLLVWKKHLGFAAFRRQLLLCAPVCQEPERCLLLCLKLFCAVVGELDESDTKELMNLVVSLGQEKALQDEPEKANDYYRQAWELDMKLSKRAMIEPFAVPKDYRVRRSGLPAYYWQLLSLRISSDHPLEVQCRFNRLMSVWEQMQENKDPSLWDAWGQKACKLISHSHRLINPEMFQKLIERCLVAIDKQNTLSTELFDAASVQLLRLTRAAFTAEENYTNKKPLPPTTTARQPKMEPLPPERHSPLLEAPSGTDKIAQLPNPGLARCGYTEHHHIIPRIQAAKSIEEVIEHFKTLSIEHQFDPTVLVRLVTPLVKSVSTKEHILDVLNILTLLQDKMSNRSEIVEEITADLECYLVWAMDKYFRNFVGDVDQSMNGLIEIMEERKAALFIIRPKLMLEIQENLLDIDDYKVFFWANKSDTSLEKFDFNHFITNAGLYHPRILLKIFSQIGDREREQYVSKLQSILGKDESHSHFVEFFIHQISGQKEKVRLFLDGILKERKVDDKGKAILLWYAYESSLITDDVLRKKIVNLDKRSPWYCFLDFLLEDVKHAVPLSKHKFFSRIKLLDRHCQEAAGFKQFSLGRLDDAADLWAECQSAYYLAMLAWHHGVQPRKQTVDVEQQLLMAAGSQEKVKARCELIHWLLKRENDGEEVDFFLKCKACCFVHIPSPMAGAESVLYQGITQYLGFGCKPDPAAGEKRIQEALDKDPLVVALRLYDLKEQGLFVLHDDSTDYLLRYAQALSKRDKDPFNRRDNYFNNLLLNYGLEALQKLLTSLHGKAESDPSNKPVYQQAANRLEEWLGQWQGGSASSANAPRKTSKVTVSPTNESQKALKESACTEDDVDQVIDCATADNWNSGALGKINQLTNRLRLEKIDLKTETKGEIEEKLHILLTVMPVGTQELAKCADAVVDLISSPEKVTELILFWITQSKFAQYRDEKAFWLERILKCFPKDHSINLNDHKEEVLCFLELLIQHQSIPKEAEYLLNGLSADERAQLLLKGLPEGINANPKMYQQYVETVQSPDSTLIDNIWRALKSESDAALVRATFTALIRQKSSELHAIKADDGRLNGIDLYNLFSDSSTSDRETLLEDTFFALRELLVKSYLTFRKANPGKRLLPKHLESTIRKFVDGKQRSIKDSLDILIMTREHKVDDAALLQDYHRKIKEKALECMDRVEAGREQQNLRLTAWAILSLTS